MPSKRTFSVFGQEWDLPTVHVPKHKDAPAVTEHRSMAVWDALAPADRDRIRAEAREAAARIMAERKR